MLIFTLGIGLTYFMVIRPCWQKQMDDIRREYDEVYHAYKLRMVRRYYPDVRHLSFAELEEQYDIDDAFDNIGQFSPKARLRAYAAGYFDSF